ncbi:MAG TPA: hypothetical protein VHC19_14065 [Pirellulales bacterium]|nr:hypothetical protein [Pirellulales bacterium]
MPSSLRQALFASFQGGRGPRHAAMAVALGILAGFVTGWNLSLAVVLLLAALFNVRTKIFAVAWGAGLATAWMASGASYRVGQLLLDGTPLGATIGAFGDSVWLAMFDWDRYTLAGGAAIGLALGLAAAKLVMAFAKTPENAPSPSQRILRPYWYLPVAGGLLVFVLAPWQLGPLLARRELLRQLAAVNGAPVEARHVHLSLWTGELELEGLQFVDPLRLDRDCLRIGLATTHVNPGALLRGRLLTDKLMLSNLRVDVARRQAAESRLPRTLTKPSYAPPARAGFATPKDEVEIDGYVRDWPLVRERLAWLGRLVSGLEALAEYDSDGGAWPGERQRVRSELARPQPRVYIASVRAEELPHVWGLGASSVLEIAAVTSRPAADESPTRVEIMAPEFTAEIFAELKLQKSGERHKVRFAAYDCQLADWAEPAAAHQAVVISGGKLDLQGEGWMNGERLEMRLHAESKPLDVRVARHDRLAGVTGTVWDQGLRRLGGLRLEAKLAGPWTAPVLSINSQQVVAQFKHQLRAASEHELVAAIEEQLAHPDATAATDRAQVAADEIPADESKDDVAQTSATEANDSEFCTVTDEPVPQTVANPFDGWRRARSVETPPQATQPYQYPRTAAPDSDPVDRFLATLDQPNAESMEAEESVPADRIAEKLAAYPEQSAVETPRIEQTRYAPPETAAQPPRPTPLSWQDRSLPGPINLVVGRQDHPSPSDVELANWPDEDVLKEEGADDGRPPQKNALSRWADGVRDRLRRAMPTRKPEAETEEAMPPEFDSEPAPGEEELIDEALSPPPTVSKKPSWFQRFWR